MSTSPYYASSGINPSTNPVSIPAEPGNSASAFAQAQSSRSHAIGGTARHTNGSGAGSTAQPQAAKHTNGSGAGSTAQPQAARHTISSGTGSTAQPQAARHTGANGPPVTGATTTGSSVRGGLQAPSSIAGSKRSRTTPSDSGDRLPGFAALGVSAISSLGQYAHQLKGREVYVEHNGSRATGRVSSVVPRGYVKITSDGEDISLTAFLAKVGLKVRGAYEMATYLYLKKEGVRVVEFFPAGPRTDAPTASAPPLPSISSTPSATAMPDARTAKASPAMAISSFSTSAISSFANYATAIRGKEVYVENAGLRAEGVVADVVAPGYVKINSSGGKSMSLREFLKQVHLPGGKTADMAAHLVLKAERMSVLEVVNNPILFAPEATVKEGIRRALHDVFKAVDVSVPSDPSRPTPSSTVTFEGLKKLTQSQINTAEQIGTKPLNVVYRVCRMDELAAIRARAPLRKSHRKGDVSQLSYEAFFHELRNHVRHGSKSSGRFISGTRKLESALWWSRCGVLPIVKIRLDKVPVWFDCEFDEGAWLGQRDAQAVHYIRASAEVVILDEIPADAYEEVSVDFDEPLARHSFTSRFMPGALTSLPSNLGDVFNDDATTFELHDKSSTKPVVATNGSSTKIVVKFGGNRGSALTYTFNTEQVVKEYIALRLYDLMKVPVPSAALHHYNLHVDGKHFPVWLLVTQFVQGGGVKHDDKNERKSIADGVLADIALFNTDALGEDYCNLISTEKHVFRVDAGASFGLKPSGSVSAPLSKLIEEAHANVYQLYSSLKANTESKALSPGLSLLKKIWGDVVTQRQRDMGGQLKQFLGLDTEESLRDIAYKGSESALPEYIDCVRLVMHRLQALYDFINEPRVASMSLPSAAAGGDDDDDDDDDDEATQVDVDLTSDANEHVLRKNPSYDDDTEEDIAPPPPTKRARRRTPSAFLGDVGKPIKLVSEATTTGASSKPAAGVGRAKHGSIEVVGHAAVRGPAPGLLVIDTTSKAEDKWKRLSPFFPHEPGFPIPGMPGKYAASVEGLWQGLKIVEGAPAVPDEDRLYNRTMKNLKVAKSKTILGHWHGAGKGLLGYIEARRKIYLPAYDYKLTRYVKDEVAELTEYIRNKPHNKLVFRDYYTNDDIDNPKKPLSHASLLKAHILQQLAS